MEIWIPILSALVLLFVSANIWMLLKWYWPDAALKRLNTASLSETDTPALSRWVDRLPIRIRKLLARISRWSLPETAGTVARPSDNSTVDLPILLLRAGWRSPHALWMFGASKSLLLLLGLLASLLGVWLMGLRLLGLGWWALALGMATGAYMLPDVALRWSIARRQGELFRAFPDALDMLRICVQAGLGLDASIERVGREMQLASPALSEEWRLTGLELRAGASRRMALQHMAQRVGLREVDAMVTMLIQADRFGTRMSDALQVHAEVLRTQRKQRAEAAAAQLPVKLLFPLIFCIFPALLTVMIGPVGLSLSAHFSRQG